MDPHDKEFETFLRQFRLRMPGPIQETASRQRRSAVRLVLAAAAILIVSFAAVMMRDQSGINDLAATVADPGEPSLYKSGERIVAGKVVQSNSAKGLTLALNDGSRVEMRSQSELKVESAADGIRIRLNDGSIVVTAAKQGSGHLYVQTKDATISVVGTVFLVHAEQSGTRIAVLEGEVHVQQGTESKRLLPGEQVASNSSIALKPIAEEISWSRSAPEYFALLPQTAKEAAVAKTGGAPEVTPPIPLPPAETGPSRDVLPFKVQVSYIKGEYEQVRTLITVQLENKDLSFQTANGRKVAHVNISGELYRSDNRQLRPISDSMAIRETPDEPVFFQETRFLDPGKYQLRLTIEDRSSQNVGVQAILIAVPRLSDPKLQASSMILAYSSTDLTPSMAAFPLGDFRVRPSGSGEFRQNQTLNIWQEFYGLTPDPVTHKSAADIELLITQNKREIKRLDSGSLNFAGSGLQVTYTNSVSLAEFAPGQYDVQIKVTDNLSKQSLVSTKNFAVISIAAAQEPPPPQPARPAPPADSPGRSIFYRACTTCHNAEVTINSPLSTRAEYANLVSRQLSMGAAVSSVEVPVLVDYLFETYGKKPGP